MRTVVDTAPRRLGLVHADQGTDCDRFDQETLAIGTGLTTVKERSAGHSWLRSLRTLMRQREGPSNCRQLQRHAVGSAFIRRSGWTFELNTITRPAYPVNSLATVGSRGALA
jgi:hypothetical protein